jgi:hypothetical protein
MRRSLFFLVIGLSILLISPSLSLSCPVCFGALDDPATAGMKYAILTLLGVTGTVFAGFISFFLRLRKHSRSSENTGGES